MAESDKKEKPKKKSRFGGLWTSSPDKKPTRKQRQRELKSNLSVGTLSEPEVDEPQAGLLSSNSTNLLSTDRAAVAVPVKAAEEPKNRAATLENLAEQENSVEPMLRPRAASEAKPPAKKKKQGWSMRNLFGGTKKEKAQPTVDAKKASPNNGNEVTNSLLDLDNNDLIDQIYKSTNSQPKAAIPSNNSPSSFTTYTPPKYGENNLRFGTDSRAEASVPPPVRKSVSFDTKPLSSAAAQGTNKLRQSIRNLLTGTAPPLYDDASTSNSNDNAAEERKKRLSRKFNTEEQPDRGVLDDDGPIDTKAALSNQYEEGMSSDDEDEEPAELPAIVQEKPVDVEKIETKPIEVEKIEEKPIEKEIEPEPIMVEPIKEVVPDREPITEVPKGEEAAKSKSTKLFDFLNALDVDADTGGNIPDNSDDDEEAPIPQTIETKPEAISAPIVVESQLQPENPKKESDVEQPKTKLVKKKVKVKKRTKRKLPGNKSAENRESDSDETESSESEHDEPKVELKREESDIDKILKSLAELKQSNSTQSKGEQSSERDRELLKKELLTELDANNKKLLERLMEEQKEMKLLLQNEQERKHDLTRELSDLKLQMQLKQEELDKEKSDVEKRTEKMLLAKDKDQKNLLEQMLKQNADQMKTFQQILLDSQKKEAQIRDNQSKKEEDDRKVLALKEKRDEKELLRIERLTEQLKLEKNLMLEEEERKQAFEQQEKQRLQDLKSLKKHDSFIDNYDYYSVNQSFAALLDEPRYDQEDQLSFGYLLRLAEEKYFSPHFYEGISWLFSYLIVLLISASFGKLLNLSTILGGNQGKWISNAELGPMIPAVQKFGISPETYILTFAAQFFHTTSRHFLNSVLRIAKVGFLFIATDKEALNIREVIAASIISGTTLGPVFCTLMPFCSDLCGPVAPFYAILTHMIVRGAIGTSKFNSMISLVCMAYVGLQVISEGFINELPLLAAGVIAGLSTGLLTAMSASSTTQYF